MFVGKIVDMLIAELKAGVESQGLGLEITSAVKRRIIQVGFDEERGARALRRTVQELLADPLSDRLIAGVAPGSLLVAGIRKGEVVIDVKPA